MGCGMSAPHQQGPTPVNLQNMQISNPQGGLFLVPQPQRDDAGIPLHYQEHDVSGERLELALAVVADYFRQRNMEVTLFACGGAVNTIHLRSRSTTADVDFFLPDISPEVGRTIEAAATHAVARMSVPLARNWLNNAQTLFMSRKVQRIIAEEARQQNTVVLRRPGLTVLAVPWAYAMMTKIDKLSKPDKRKPYDGPDAAVYLRKHIQTYGGRPISMQEIQHWTQHYEVPVTRECVAMVSRAYLDRDGAAGIVQ